MQAKITANNRIPRITGAPGHAVAVQILDMELLIIDTCR